MRGRDDDVQIRGNVSAHDHVHANDRDCVRVNAHPDDRANARPNDHENDRVLMTWHKVSDLDHI